LIKFIALSVGEKARFILENFLRTARPQASAVYPLLTTEMVNAIPVLGPDEALSEYFRGKINPLARFPIKLDGMVNGAIRLTGAR
jgi:hypothetical protein